MNPAATSTCAAPARPAHQPPAPPADASEFTCDPIAESYGVGGVEADTCPLCRGRRLHYAFSTAARRVVRCAECRLVLLSPRPGGADVPAIEPSPAGDFRIDEHDQDDEDAVGAGAILGSDRDRESLAAATARHHLAQLARYRGGEGGALLVIDPGPSALASQASARGFDVTHLRLRPPQSVDPAAYVPGGFDVCALTGAVESAPDPLALLRLARRLLKPDGVLLVISPSLDSLSARRAGPRGSNGSTGCFTGAVPDRLTWFDANTIQSALHQVGFRQAIVQLAPRRAHPCSLAGRLTRLAAPAARAARLFRPTPWGESRTLPGGGMLALARAAALPACRTLSVIVPAYNEAATVGPMLDALLRKRLGGMRVEVIVVESNSTDGTRDVVARYASHPRVRVVLEDRPRGKGHAVRTGLSRASGDYVLIQDADLEYDLEDYDALLEPLEAGREALVLGSRHGGNAWWKMRRFTGQPVASLALNCGHWFFTTLLNLLFRQRLKDPFTMYKVFRRDCLFGLDFQCDRFDFDYELLVKLIRKGYQPVEIPVNYRSRSFKEGKKISAFRDPFNWLRALAWLRFVRVDPLAEVERRREAAWGAEDAARVTVPSPVPSRAAA